MTWLGKILVMFNLALSMVLAGWAMNLYTTRVDWTDEKGKDGRPDGELVERKKQLDAGWNQIHRAVPSWQEARSTLIAMEDGGKWTHQGKEYTVNGRRANQKWYRDELEALRKGDQPVKLLVLDEHHHLTFPPDAEPLTPRPRMSPPALRPWDWYNTADKNIRESLIVEEKRLTELIKQDSDLTDQLIGAKGLHQRLSNERAKRRKIMEEQDLVKLPLIYTFVQSDLLQKRMRSLELRLEELQKARAARAAALGSP